MLFSPNVGDLMTAWFRLHPLCFVCVPGGSDGVAVGDLAAEWSCFGFTAELVNCCSLS